MDTIDRTTLAALARHHGFPSVSIYLPTHISGPGKDQDPIRLRNLIADAETRLAEQGMRAADARALLSELAATDAEPLFWREMGGGLAAFVSAEGTQLFRLDVAVPEQLVVGTRYYLRPLALAYRGERHFYALALDRNRSRLFEGDGASIGEIRLDPSVTSFAETAKYDEREESLQNTSHASPESVSGVGRRIAGFHGQGAQNYDKGELERYMSALEAEVSRKLGSEHTVPLLLLGPAEEIGAYRAANTYRGLAAGGIEGATDYRSADDVHKLALSSLAPEFTAQQTRDLADLENKPSSQVSSDPAEILVAAASGRVNALFFDQSTGPYGVFDRQLMAVSEVCGAAPRYLEDTARDEEAAGSCGWDLVDLALAETILHAGRVHTFEGEDAPVSGVAALLRF